MVTNVWAGNSNVSSSTDIVSLVESVTVTKFDILSRRQLGVELTYGGTRNAPAVKIDVSAIKINSKLADDITNEINFLNAQGGPISPACATSNGGNGNGGTGAPGGVGGDSIGGDGGVGGDVFGGTGADGASACETTDSCFNDNSP